MIFFNINILARLHNKDVDGLPSVSGGLQFSEKDRGGIGGSTNPKKNNANSMTAIINNADPAWNK